jgi:hypothetical protein
MVFCYSFVDFGLHKSFHSNFYKKKIIQIVPQNCKCSWISKGQNVNISSKKILSAFLHLALFSRGTQNIGKIFFESMEKQCINMIASYRTERANPTSLYTKYCIISVGMTIFFVLFFSWENKVIFQLKDSFIYLGSWNLNWMLRIGGSVMPRRSAN